MQHRQPGWVAQAGVEDNGLVRWCENATTTCRQVNAASGGRMSWCICLREVCHNLIREQAGRHSWQLARLLSLVEALLVLYDNLILWCRIKSSGNDINDELHNDDSHLSLFSQTHLVRSSLTFAARMPRGSRAVNIVAQHCRPSRLSVGVIEATESGLNTYCSSRRTL